jgi:thiol:disulfide interchange protein/DsbC/DsbD-like thiol-disulfide interchange protein
VRVHPNLLMTDPRTRAAATVVGAHTVGCIVILLFVLGIAGPSRAAEVSPGGPRVRVELVAERQGIEPGEPFWLGLRQQIAPGWHTYWENPGDSGEPATIDWSLPPGFAAGPIVWPHPERIPAGPFMSYGYEGEVLLLTRVTPPADLVAGTPVTLRARARWLVCEKECIPEEAALELTLPVAGGARRELRSAEAFARARRAVPVPSPWPAELTTTDAEFALAVSAPGLAADRIAEIWFYPREWGVIDHVAPQRATVSPDGIRIAVARGPRPETTERPVEGVLVVKERFDAGVVSRAFLLRAAPAGSAQATVATADAVASPLAAVGLALLGGLLLNLMPCVLPVLSVKTLSLAGHAGAAPAAMRRHGVAYTAGVLASFAVVAGALIALRSAGEQIGWGFQLQSPRFVTALAYLFFAMALALSGVITIGGRMAGVGHGLAARARYAGSFFSGALAAVAATPCTAPFMGVAVGFASTQPAAIALLVFGALGLGLALPYLALSFAPGWQRSLPRPGPWMERLKQLLAFPLYASVAWLVWVLSQQAGPSAVATALGGLVLIGFGAWLYESSRAAPAPWRRVAAGTAALALAAAVTAGYLGVAARSEVAGVEGNKRAAEAFTPGRVAELRAQGRAVFVNFTAAWCITCLVNERVALRSPAVAEAFTRKGVVSLTADWTSRDAQIAQVLGSFGRSGVPLYVLYPPLRGKGAADAEPMVLPALLTEGVILDAVGRI